MKALVNNKTKKFAGLKKTGFTLIELLVVLAIFTVIMSVALFNQAGLSSNILLTNLAYETALAVREAQTYGIGVRATGGTANFDKGYGVYFDVSKPSQVVVFGDSNNDMKYSDTTELQSLYEIKNQRGNYIKYFCSSGACLPSGQKMSIMFKRPNPEASFYIIDNSGNVSTTTGPVSITVSNVNSTNCRNVIVEVTGQIRVESLSSGSCSVAP